MEANHNVTLEATAWPAPSCLNWSASDDWTVIQAAEGAILCTPKCCASGGGSRNIGQISIAGQGVNSNRCLRGTTKAQLAISVEWQSHVQGN